MHSSETAILLAIITAAIIFMVLVAYFIHNIAAYQRKKIALTREQVSSDLLFIENERSRIAFDLHDDIGNRLSALRLQLELAAQSPEGKNIDRLAEELGEVIDKIRQLSRGMLPVVLQAKGLKAAIEQLDISCGTRMHLSCDVMPLSAHTELHLFRIAQEWVNNCCKHAQASQLTISITTEKNKIRMRYTDDGKGFDKKEIQQKSPGVGLRSIHSRVDLLNGSLYLVTQPGKGVVWLAEFRFG